jgi:DNA polymerase V
MSFTHSSRIFALVDANNFYASCERVFRPALVGKPIVVLSNNDGCIIARSNETKALGIRMGEPFYKAKPLIQAHGVHVFSANFALYGDLSARVMSSLSEFAPEMEIYSIDEAFLDLSGMQRHHLNAYGRQMKQLVEQWTGIPISVGIAETKTLAQMANYLAKKIKKGKWGAGSHPVAPSHQSPATSACR